MLCIFFQVTGRISQFFQGLTPSFVPFLCSYSMGITQLFCDLPCTWIYTLTVKVVRNLANLVTMDSHSLIMLFPACSRTSFRHLITEIREISPENMASISHFPGEFVNRRSSLIARQYLLQPSLNPFIIKSLAITRDDGMAKIRKMLAKHPCTGYVRRVTHDEIADAIG